MDFHFNLLPRAPNSRDCAEGDEVKPSCNDLAYMKNLDCLIGHHLADENTANAIKLRSTVEWAREGIGHAPIPPKITAVNPVGTTESRDHNSCYSTNTYPLQDIFHSQFVPYNGYVFNVIEYRTVHTVHSTRYAKRWCTDITVYKVPRLLHTWP